jgi:hypothetical protein
MRAMRNDPINPDHAASLSVVELNAFGRLSDARDVLKGTLALWENEDAHTFLLHSFIAMGLVGGGSLDSARAAAAAARKRHPFEWAVASIVGAPETEWLLATAEDWQRLESDPRLGAAKPVFAIRRAVAENRLADARRLAPTVRAAVANPDAGLGLGSADRGLWAAFAYAVESDTARALQLIHDLEQQRCGKPPVFIVETAWVTHRAMVRALNGDTAGARRTLQTAFDTKPWPTREALRYHPILGPVLGYPRPAP